jgi:TonB family protein
MLEPQRNEGLGLRAWAWATSASLHLALLWLLLRVPAPEILKVNPVMQGNGGSSVELVFTGSDPAAAADTQSPIRRLGYSPPAPPRAKVERAPAARHPDVTATKKSGTPSRAGSPNGSALFGELSGRDVRPAIPVTWADPEVYPWQVSADVNGRVVVEITIDAQGAVVDAKVIESLHRTIDEKVLAAAWKWRFRPATVDGVPTASRQDLVFRYPS